MKYLLAYVALMLAIGAMNTNAGRIVRFVFIAGPCVMAHACDLPSGNAIIHWHI